MRPFLMLAMLLCAVTAFAQTDPVAAVANPAPSGGMFEAIRQALGSHLGVGAVASYDWSARDWDRPYSVGPVASWVINDQLVIMGGAKYILNAEEEKDRWRSEVKVLIPMYGAERMR